MEKIKLQSGIIYGPVNSRRLGSSLGINLMPASNKVCSFDCVYCQYGQTFQKIAGIPFYVGGLPFSDQVGLALEKWFRSNPETRYDYITFSGNGEPSLHPQFEEIVKIVKALRDKFAPQSKLAILSNASTLDRDSVRRAIRELNLPVMKLDAGDEETFLKINQPHPSVRKEIQPKAVQIYSLARPARETVKPVSKAKLDQIVIQLREDGIQANAY